MEALPLLLFNLFLRCQQKAKQDRVRQCFLWQSTESVKILEGSVYMQAATEVSPQPPTEKKTDFCIEVAVYSTVYMHVKNITENSRFTTFWGIYLRPNQLNSKLSHVISRLQGTLWFRKENCIIPNFS